MNSITDATSLPLLNPRNFDSKVVYMGQINCSEDMLYEKTVSEKDIFDGRVFKVKVRQIETPEGKPSSRELVFHNGGACILPVDEDQNVYLVKQFRSPFERVLLEAPAGKLDDGEEPLVCASREITEETGFKASSIEYLGDMISTPGYCSEIIYMYLATGLTYEGGNPDASEFLSTVKMPLKEALSMAEMGQIEDAKTLIIIYKAARRFGL